MKPYARVVAAEISRLKRCRAYKQHWWGCVWQGGTRLRLDAAANLSSKEPTTNNFNNSSGGATRTAQVAHDYRWWQPGAKIGREHREKGAYLYEWRSQTPVGLDFNL